MAATAGFDFEKAKLEHVLVEQSLGELCLQATFLLVCTSTSKIKRRLAIILLW